MHIPLFYFLLPAVVLLFGLLPLAFRQSPPIGASKIRSRSIMTKPEQIFFQALCRLLPGHAVFPQVAFSALLITTWKNYTAFNQFSQKRADYVICDRVSLAVVAIIELDDSSHNSAMSKRKDAARDAMLVAAGYKIIRVATAVAHQETELQSLLQTHFASGLSFSGADVARPKTLAKSAPLK